jgi:hypothetical protein
MTPDTSITAVHEVRLIDYIHELNALAATLKDAMLDPKVGNTSYPLLRDELLKVSVLIRKHSPEIPPYNDPARPCRFP